MAFLSCRASLSATFLMKRGGGNDFKICHISYDVWLEGGKGMVTVQHFDPTNNFS